MIRMSMASTLALALAVPAFAQAGTPGDPARIAGELARLGHAPQPLIMVLAPARRLTVTSPSFAAGAEIPRDATQYGANRFPGLRWEAGPAGTHSYAIVLQGELGARPADGTSIHLTVINLPASTRALPVGLGGLPAGASYGVNVHGIAAPYAGPHTHDAAHHAYHAQVFALDAKLPPGAGADPAALVAAMRGHVLAAGELVGYAARPADAAPPPTSAPTARIDSGLISGVVGRDPTIAVFKGIPYAAPPVGALRWRPPAPVQPWIGVRPANAFGAACPQPGADMAKGLPQSEDCLTLNVWSGATPGEKRPVYVWIYGGGFIGGTGASPEFDGEGLAKKGIIVVTFNYRVGVFGFLATPELSAESGHNASGNYGLLDDISALQWVRRNIAAFGGDPEQVTIGGQSAGAGSVGFMAMSPLARGLFRAGIAESHARDPRDTELRYLSISYRHLDAAERQGSAYTTAHGAHSLAELRAMPWQDLVKGSDTVDMTIETGSAGKPPLFRPVVDGWVVPQGYAVTYAAHAQNPVMMVAGNNKDETGAVPETAFVPLRTNPPPPRAGMPQVNVTLAAFTAAAHRKFGSLAEAFLALYPAHDDAGAAIQNDAAARDDSRIATWMWGRAWTKGDPAPVYTYFWTHAPPGAGHDMRGAFHGSEIYYAFDSLDAVDRPWTDADRRIAATMSSYWANIIARGDPNGAGLPVWPRYDPARAQVMELGDGFGPIPVASPAKIAFWQKFYATQKAW